MTLPSIAAEIRGSQENTRFMVLLAAAVGLFLAASLFVQARTVLLHEETSDFSAYFSGYMVKRVLGEGIYDRAAFLDLPAAQTVQGDIRQYIYTPLKAELLSLFMPSQYVPARLAWLVLEHVGVLALLVLSALIAVRVVNADPVRAFLLAALVIVGFSAIERNLFYGQASVVLAVVMAAAVLLHYRGRHYQAAFWAALASVFKVYPLVFLIAFLLQGHYRQAAAMAGFLIAIPLVSMGLFGAHDWIEYYHFQSGHSLVDRDLARTAVELVYEAPNYAPTAMLFLLSDQFGWGWSQLQAWRVSMALVLAGGAICVLAFFGRIREEIGFLQLTGLGLCAIMLISPMLWNHVFILLLPVYAALLYRAVYDPRVSSAWFMLTAVSFVLIAFPDFLTNLSFTNQGALVLLKYTKLYGLLIFAGVLLLSPLGRRVESNACERVAAAPEPVIVQAASRSPL